MNRYLTGMAGALTGAAFFVAACGGGGTSGPAATSAPGSSAKTETKTGTSGAATSGSPTSAGAAATKGKASGEPVKIGLLCDRSGAVAAINTPMCDGIKDWFEYLNTTGGGIKGRPIAATEIDMKYEVPVGVDGYKRMTTRDLIPQILPAATPLVDALAQSAAQDKVVLWSPGFGLSDVQDGAKFPYVFAGVATYQSQAQAIMQYLADDWKQQGKTGNPKVIYLFYDNPAGRDPLEAVKSQSKGIGLDLIDTIAVPATTVDMTTILTQVKEKNPDYVMVHLFGRTPALALQAAQKLDFPREKMVGFVWAFSEDDARVAGDAAKGFRGVVFHASYSDNPQALLLVEQMWKDSGKSPYPRAREIVHYPRGLTIGNLMAQAAQLADDPNNGESIKKGAESMKDFTANGLLPGTTLTPEDHSGARKVRMYQVTDANGSIQMVRDWFEGPK